MLTTFIKCLQFVVGWAIASGFLWALIVLTDPDCLQDPLSAVPQPSLTETGRRYLVALLIQVIAIIVSVEHVRRQHRTSPAAGATPAQGWTFTWRHALFAFALAMLCLAVWAGVVESAQLGLGADVPKPLDSWVVRAVGKGRTVAVSQLAQPLQTAADRCVLTAA